MNIVDATPEDIAVLKQRGRPSDTPGRRPRQETAAVMRLKVGAAVRIENHAHSGTPCRMAATLRLTATRYGQKLLMRHDGADLLVARVR